MITARISSGLLGVRRETQATRTTTTTTTKTKVMPLAGTIIQVMVGIIIHSLAIIIHTIAIIIRNIAIRRCDERAE